MPPDEGYGAPCDDMGGGRAGVPVVDPGPVTPALVKSAGRVLQILEFFDEIQRDAKVQEIATRLNFPQSSTSVLLKCLVQMGYLDHDKVNRSFIPSPRVALMGTWIDKGPVRNGNLIRMMEDLAARTGETVMLAARNGIHAHYIRVIQTKRATRFHVPQDSRRPVVWSATGFALLSLESDSLIQGLCRRANGEAGAGQPIIDYKRTLAAVAQTRRDGFFISKELVTPGTAAISIALPQGIDWHERPLAIGLSGPLQNFAGREMALVQMMRDCVAQYLKTS